jgi:micrococcal nuclease
VIRVVDGDTIEVRAKIWLGLELTVSARIRGIDAPELRGKCRQESMMAAAATDRLVEVTSGTGVRLTKIEEDKYAGRVVADVTTSDGTEVAAVMLASGLVRAYDGGARGAWCGLASLGG